MAAASSVPVSVRCALPLCALEADSNAVLHPLPEEGPLRQAWITFVRRCPGGGGRGWMPPVNQQSFVCSLHFAFNSYMYSHSSAMKKCLRSDAVPSLYPRRRQRNIARTILAGRRRAEMLKAISKGTGTFARSPSGCVHHASGSVRLNAGKESGEEAADSCRQCASADASAQCCARVNVKSVQCGLDAKWSVCTQTSTWTQRKMQDAACCTDDCLEDSPADLEEGGTVRDEEARTQEGLHFSPAGGSSPQPHTTAGGRPPGRCQFCPYTSVNGSHLKSHLRVHTGEKPFQCKDCSMAFKTRQGYQNHVWCHVGEKPYKCDQCPFVSSQSALLMRHMYIHKSGKHFVCNICSYACVRSDHLKRHMTMHTSYKSHKCSMCFYATANKDNYVRHVKKHHSHLIQRESGVGLQKEDEHGATHSSFIEI